jgi:transketolase
MIDFQPPSTGLGNYAGTYIRYAFNIYRLPPFSCFLSYGVREHGMGAIANGLSAYGGIIPFVGTFMVSYNLDAQHNIRAYIKVELCILCCWCRPSIGS